MDTTARRRSPGAPPAPRRRPAVLVRASSLITAFALVLGGLLAAPAHATPSAGTSGAPEDGQGTLQPVVVVMDYSSSMLEKDADASGTTRLAAAREATTSLLDNAPDGADLGMVVYGANTVGDCKDITTLQKVGPTDVGALKKKIAGLDAVGETPIGAALLHAAQELEGIDGEKSIILVSDGEENCSEPPACEAAQELAGKGIGLTVHTIGFKVNDAAREELTCVAEATGGTYVQADNATELQTELQTKTVRAFQGYVPQGTPVEGGETLHSSPQLTPGQYLDEFERGGSSLNSDDGTMKFYNLGTISPGERAHVSALLVPEADGKDTPNESAGLVVELVNGQGASCSSADRPYRFSDDGGRPIAGYVVNKDYEEGATSGCFADGTGQLFAKVMRTGERQSDRPLPVELKYVLEPAVDESTLEEPAREALPPQSVKLSGAATAVPGGGSFNDATEVDNGTVLADSVMPEESRYYRVHVGYGQRLNVRASQGNVEEAGPNGIILDVYSAVREPVRVVGDQRLWRGDTGETITQNMRVPVSQSNRDGSVGDDAYLAGDYYVVVSAEKWSGDRNREAYAYELALDVTGEEQDGPMIAEPGTGEVVRAGAQSDPVDPAETAPADGDAVPASAGSDGSGSGSGEDDAGADTATAAAPADSGGGNPLPWFLGGLLGSAAIGATALLLSRSRPDEATATTQAYWPHQEGQQR
ncbi:MAG: VWA domain-containing protein [Micrococcus sp.]|nr:VWA domain-containing protein [Micrococcus sp.]